MSFTKIQVKRGLAADWTSADTVLADGEPGFEHDTGKFKLGDGTTNWSGLPYQGGGNIDYRGVWDAAVTDYGPGDIVTHPLEGTDWIACHDPADTLVNDWGVSDLSVYTNGGDASLAAGPPQVLTLVNGANQNGDAINTTVAITRPDDISVLFTSEAVSGTDLLFSMFFWPIVGGGALGPAPGGVGGGGGFDGLGGGAVKFNVAERTVAFNSQAPGSDLSDPPVTTGGPDFLNYPVEKKTAWIVQLDRGEHVGSETAFRVRVGPVGAPPVVGTLNEPHDTNWRLGFGAGSGPGGGQLDISAVKAYSNGYYWRRLG